MNVVFRVQLLKSNLEVNMPPTNATGLRAILATILCAPWQNMPELIMAFRVR